MKKLFTLLSILTVLSAQAASIPEKHQTDSFQIGVSSSSAQKNFLFDLGLGASNPALGVDISTSSLNYNKNTLNLGNGSNSQKSFTANIGNGATNPKIIWDSVNQQWAFSNDGTNFTSIGSGSGGASGINLLQNGDFESGITLGWTNTGGTFAAASSGPNLLVGKKSATFTASANGQSVQSILYAVPNGLAGQSCAASMMYLGGDTGLTFKVVDNASNVLASQVIQTATSAQIISMPFQCPTSGTIQVKISSSASAALIAFDQMFLGQSTLIATSQANYYGGVLFTQASGCLWSTSTSGTWEVFSTQSSCNAPVYTGNVDTSYGKRPGVTISNLPPGEYLVTATTQIQSDAGTSQCYWSLGDAAGGRSSAVSMSAGWTGPINLSGHFSYATAQSSVTFQVQAWHDGTGTGDPCDLNLSNLGGGQNQASLEIQVYRFPTHSEIAVRPETINWYLNAVTTSGSNSFMPTTGTRSEIVQSDLAMLNYGTMNALQTCTGTEVASGASCSGNENFGFSFFLPAVQTVHVCAEWNHETVNSSGANTVYGLFETDNNSQSTLQGGNTFPTTSFGETGGSNNEIKPMNICWDFPFTSAGQKTIRLFADATPATTQYITPQGNVAIKWTARPLTQNVPAPILVGQPVAFKVDNGTPAGSLTGSVYNVAVWGGLGPIGFDTNNGYSTSTGLYTIPAGAGGLWEFACQLGIASTVLDNYEFQSSMYVNGNGVGIPIFTRQQVYLETLGSKSEFGMLQARGMRMMNPGDTIGCYGLTNVAGTWSCNSPAGNCFFEGRLIR